MPARWRLRGKHYLNIVPRNGDEAIQWEYKETDRTSGKSGRKLFPVPALLDPDEREIIVSNAEDRAYPNDIIFVGEPTPDMEPINEEADKISESLEAKWAHPIESLPGTYSQSLLSGLEKQLADLMAKNPIQPMNPVSANQVDPEKFAALEKQVQALIQQNAALQAQIESKPARRA